MCVLYKIGGSAVLQQPDAFPKWLSFYEIVSMDLSSETLNLSEISMLLNCAEIIVDTQGKGGCGPAGLRACLPCRNYRRLPGLKFEQGRLPPFSLIFSSFRCFDFLAAKEEPYPILCLWGFQLSYHTCKILIGCSSYSVLRL